MTFQPLSKNLGESEIMRVVVKHVGLGVSSSPNSATYKLCSLGQVA